VRMLSL